MKKLSKSIFPFAERKYMTELLAENKTFFGILPYKFHFIDKQYTVADTPLSYRQINSLGSNGILRSNRENKNGWRKFDFRELVFLLIVEEVRKYGLKDSQLEYLRSAFFDEKNMSKVDLAMIACISGYKIILTFDADGRVCFHDLITIDLLEDKTGKSLINVNLNSIVTEQWKKTGWDTEEYKNSFDIFAEELGKRNLGEKELEIIKAIRTGSYESVNVKFENGKVSFLEKTDSVTTETRIIEILKENSFQSIKLEQKNGKVVSLKRTIKEKL